MTFATAKRSDERASSSTLSNRTP